jgi:sugar phosphate isomerase/epimerase
MIEFGCHTWGFNDKPLTEALGTIARLGFRYVDIGSGPHLDVVQASEKPERTADTFKRDLEKFNLKVSDLYLMLPRIAMADDERREHEVTSFEKLMPFAVALGTPGITVSPGVAGTEPLEEQMDRVADVLRRFIDMAGEHDIALSVEPHLDSVTPTPDAALQLVNRVDGLTVTLDWAHFVKQGMKADDGLPLLRHVRHVQVRQAAPMRMQTPFDQGVLDLERVMTLLVSVGYEGVITVEIMQTVGWHGAAKVDSVAESLAIRDALKSVRDRLTTA